MLLSNCNIQELVTEQASAYLNSQPLKFEQLKEHLISKGPIAAIHDSTVDALKAAKSDNQIRIQKTLELQALEKQTVEDNLLTKADELLEQQDLITRGTIQRELAHIPTLLGTHETEIKILKHQLKKDPDSTRLAAAIEVHQHEMAQIKLTRTTLQTQLKELEKRAQVRANRQSIINARQKAQSEYHTQGQSVQEALSESIQQELAKNIQDQFHALDKQFEALVADAPTVNYGIFFELVSDELANNTLVITNSEQEALRAVLKMLQDHFEFEYKIAATTLKLQQKKQSISALDAKLLEYQAKRMKLNESLEQLNQENQRLGREIETLSEQVQKHEHWYAMFSKPVLSLTVLMILSCIPIVLFLLGIIPAFIAPFWAVLILSIPPVVLFIGAASTGILSLIYKTTAETENGVVTLNTQSVTANKTQINDLTQALAQLEAQSTAQEERINKENAAYLGLEQELELNQENAKSSLAQASSIVPISFAHSNLFKPHEVEPQIVSLQPELFITLQQN